jgi:outer membrane biosynthesis protein TonB
MAKFFKFCVIFLLAVCSGCSHISDNKKPSTELTKPSSPHPGYALYYEKMRKRIETIGTSDFPQYGGKKLYGTLNVSIPVSQDGTLYDKGEQHRTEKSSVYAQLDDATLRLHIAKSSGNAQLDEAALNIVGRAAPFEPIPQELRSHSQHVVLIAFLEFKFDASGVLQTSVRRPKDISYAPSKGARYASKIAALIKSHTAFTMSEGETRNDTVKYRISLNSDGAIASIEKMKSAVVPGFDQAVFKAIQMSQPFPKDGSGKVPKEFIIVDRPIER